MSLLFQFAHCVQRDLKDISAADLPGGAQGSPAMPSQMYFGVPAWRSGCWCTPVPQQAAGDGASPDSQSDPSHPFSHACKTGSRAFLASSEWLAALSNVLSCLCLKLVLGQEYLSAGLAALPVFKLCLVISGYMCLSKGGSY